MRKLSPLAAAAMAVLVLAASGAHATTSDTSTATATTGFTCSFNGGKPGEPTADGNNGPWQENGQNYAATAASIRDAAKEARLACTAAEQLGAQGCLFTGCVDMAATETKPVTN